MKKLILLLAMAGVGSIMCGQQQKERSFSPGFEPSSYSETPSAWQKLRKPAWWMRPKTQAWTLVKEGEPIPAGYIVDRKFKDPDDPTQTLVRVRKKLPISTREEFWNKFISGGDDKSIEEEIRMKKPGPSIYGIGDMPYEEWRKERDKEAEWKEDPGRRARSLKRFIEEEEFLKKVEKETPQHYVKPKFSPFEKPQAPTGFFSGLRNWFNKYFGSGTTSYTPAKPTSVPYTPTEPISVPFQYPESE